MSLVQGFHTFTFGFRFLCAVSLLRGQVGTNTENSQRTFDFVNLLDRTAFCLCFWLCLAPTFWDENIKLLTIDFSCVWRRSESFQRRAPCICTKKKGKKLIAKRKWTTVRFSWTVLWIDGARRCKVTNVYKYIRQCHVRLLI